MMDFDTFRKLPNNVGDLGKIIIAIGFEWLPKVQKIAQSGHTDSDTSPQCSIIWLSNMTTGSYL